MPERSGTNQQVKIADDLVRRSQASSFSAEKPTHFFIEWQKANGSEEFTQTSLASCWVAGVRDSLAEFRKRYYGKADAFRLQFPEPLNDLWLPIHVVDRPVRVNQVAEAHRSGFGRVEISRSA